LLVHVPEANEVSVFLAALGGACIGFLWYNAHPAEVFMGDTGSLAIGGAVGMAAILIHREILLLAQARPGDAVRFVPITVQEAEKIARQQEKWLDNLLFW
jgi:UDP-N-acetylmuramyl pentapeptide phosphotransferase/UDP-N-acetylglucosamine-1-phosphate transferase